MITYYLHRLSIKAEGIIRSTYRVRIVLQTSHMNQAGKGSGMGGGR